LGSSSKKNAPVAQLVRVPGLRIGGYKSTSCRVYKIKNSGYSINLKIVVCPLFLFLRDNKGDNIFWIYNKKGFLKVIEWMTFLFRQTNIWWNLRFSPKKCRYSWIFWFFPIFAKKKVRKKKNVNIKNYSRFLLHTYLKDEILLANYKQLESKKTLESETISSIVMFFLFKPSFKGFHKYVFPFLLHIFTITMIFLRVYKELPWDGIRIWFNLKHHDIVLIRNRIECLIEANLRNF